MQKKCPQGKPPCGTPSMQATCLIGQERYKSLASMYYRGAAAALVVYDITSQDSFERAKYWVKELLMNSNDNIVIALTGNKCDLVYLCHPFLCSLPEYVSLPNALLGACPKRDIGYLTLFLPPPRMLRSCKPHLANCTC